jgi:Domain of unknown function (DUF4277)
MPELPPTIEVSPVQHLPILTAYADQRGLGGWIHDDIPTEMRVDAGTVVRGLVVDTLRGRSLLYRLAECFARQDTALLWGTPRPAHAVTDDTVGRVLERL